MNVFLHWCLHLHCLFSRCHNILPLKVNWLEFSEHVIIINYFDKSSYLLFFSLNCSNFFVNIVLVYLIHKKTSKSYKCYHWIRAANKKLTIINWEDEAYTLFHTWDLVLEKASISRALNFPNSALRPITSIESRCLWETLQKVDSSVKQGKKNLQNWYQNLYRHLL